MKPPRTEMIDSYLAELRSSLPFIEPISTVELREQFEKQNYVGMVKLVRDHMKLDLRVRVGVVAEGGSDYRAPAWVRAPEPMPRYGSAEFKRTVVTVFLRKSFLQRSSFEKIVMAIAHELSHIVLFGIGHSHQETEEAVDLTAMLLGYRDIYFVGSDFAETRSGAYASLGYLTPEEVRYASVALGRPSRDFRKRPFDARAALLKFISTFTKNNPVMELLVALVGVAAICVCLYGLGMGR